MNVLEAIQRSEELHNRIVALETAIFRFEMDKDLKILSKPLIKIKEEYEQEATDIKIKFESIEFN